MPCKFAFGSFAVNYKALGKLVAQICILITMTTSAGLIFIDSPFLALVGGGALILYLALCSRHFTSATWVTTGLCTVLLVVTVLYGIDLETLVHGLDRMGFLATFLAVLVTLRVSASNDPQIVEAGQYLTEQSPARRYVAMNCGGHALGLLLNLGGLAVLLEMTRRSLQDARAMVTPAIVEARLRRMTTATLRGFSLLPLWSPFGLGMNVLLLSMPGLDYSDIAPFGVAAAVVFFGWGWLLDWITAPRGQIAQQAKAARGEQAPNPHGRKAVVHLLRHILLLVGLVWVIHIALDISFQSALLPAVPAYSLIWAAENGRRAAVGSGAAIRQTVVATIDRLPMAAAEIGVFASAGLLSVLALEVIPLDAVQQIVADMIGQPWQMVVLLNLTMFSLATLGVNPIISASVLGSLVSQLQIPGLSDAAAALCLAGTWSCVMGFTPLITTVAYAGALIKKSPWVVGVRWNGLYALSTLAGWTISMAIVTQLGVI